MRLLMMTQAIDLDNPILGFTHQWVNELATHFEHVHVISRLGGRHDLAENVTLHAYATPDQPDQPLARHLFFHRKLASLILGNQVDTVFVHMIPKWVLMAAPYAKIGRKPMTLWYTHVAPSPILRRAHRLVNFGLTAASESYHYYDEKVKALGHGINVNYFRPTDRTASFSPFRILMVGRLSPVKRIDLLIEALAVLKARQVETAVFCQIIGGPVNPEDGSYEQLLRQKIADYGLEQSVELTGAVPYEQIRTYYQNSHLLVNLTHANSFDKTVLEAMACGIPVLTSNPSFFDMLEKHGRFLTLELADASTLADQIEMLCHLSHPDLQALRLSLRQEIVTNHNLATLMQNIADTLKEPS